MDDQDHGNNQTPWPPKGDQAADDTNDNRIPDRFDPAAIDSPAQQIVDEPDAEQALEKGADVDETVPADAEVHEDVDVVKDLNKQTEEER